ncbi:hypothetical protein MLD38_008038 [Melastoma candidum]|uniref:Uncharacterized protein n=1 Tax=Melastoma candidum TaxID=119954 RepID=A0ACB9RW37_9MYRT|nr:hypothetical protein MLD38_008038 [Melastoma candidum]
MESLTAARDLLRSSLEKSDAVRLELDRIGPRQEEMMTRFMSLQPPRDMKFMSPALKHRLDSAIRPAEAVVEVLSTIRRLEKSLRRTAPCSCLSSYLSVMRRLEQALKLLSDNCALAILWLQDVAELLEDDVLSDETYVLNAKRSLSILREFQAAGKRSRLDGGILNFAFNQLEAEFERLLTEGTGPCISPLPSTILSEPSKEKLRVIIQSLLNHGEALGKCEADYVAVRSMNVRESLRSFDLEYLDTAHPLFEDEEYMESTLRLWGEHLEYAVQHVLKSESYLCKEVFGEMTSDTSTSCFARIASNSGIISFLQFGKKVAEGKKSPSKLLNLLKIFAVLDGLRLDFTQLFGGEACTDIQALTRDLIRDVVNGAWEIFWELSFQVELQRQSQPPSDGSIPLLVDFVMSYCNQLLGDAYRPTMIQVLAIHQSWNFKKYQEGHFSHQVYNIVKELNLNLDEWSKAYHDRALSYLFMMNNHHHFCKLKGTRLGDMMGESWLKAHEQYRDHYAALYFKESWGKLLNLLTEEFSDSCPGDEEGCRNLMIRKLKSFHDAFEGTYKEQFNWTIPDESLRESTCRLIKQAIMPAYKCCMEQYQNSPGLNHLGSNHRASHSITTLQDMLGSLFLPKPRKGIDDEKHNTASKTSYTEKIASLVPSQICLAAA